MNKINNNRRKVRRKALGLKNIMLIILDQKVYLVFYYKICFINVKMVGKILTDCAYIFGLKFRIFH